MSVVAGKLKRRIDMEGRRTDGSLKNFGEQENFEGVYKRLE